MTLIGVTATSSAVDLLADGLATNEHLTVTPTRRCRGIIISTLVPGRTTLQKIFPHESLPIAIAHIGNNLRDNAPISQFITRFWAAPIRRLADERELIGGFKHLAGSATNDSYLLVGFDSRGHILQHAIGTGFQHMDNIRIWGGSGRDGVSSQWSDIDDLYRHAGQFFDDCRVCAPYSLPFFPNAFGGHWHRLRLHPGHRPHWVIKPSSAGVRVASLLPMSSVAVDGLPAQIIQQKASDLKRALKRRFRKNVVRKSLAAIDSELRREQIARLIAIFDEVERAPFIATSEDAEAYCASADSLLGILSA